MTAELKPTAEGAAVEDIDLESLPGGLPAALEAVLMIAEKPLDELTLASAVGRPAAEVGAALEALRQEYDNGYTSLDSSPDCARTGQAPPVRPRGFELRRLAGGWRVYSRTEFAPLVQRFVLEGQTARLSRAALETLAVIAYRQPVTRARISAIRGVNVDSVVRTLVQRGLIDEDESGSDPETGATRYRTTGYFLEQLGLNSLDELPMIAPLLPGVENLDEFDEHSETTTDTAVKLRDRGHQ